MYSCRDAYRDSRYAIAMQLEQADFASREGGDAAYPRRPPHVDDPRQNYESIPIPSRYPGSLPRTAIPAVYSLRRGARAVCGAVGRDQNSNVESALHHAGHAQVGQLTSWIPRGRSCTIQQASAPRAPRIKHKVLRRSITIQQAPASTCLTSQQTP